MWMPEVKKEIKGLMVFLYFLLVIFFHGAMIFTDIGNYFHGGGAAGWALLQVSALLIFLMAVRLLRVMERTGRFLIFLGGYFLQPFCLVQFYFSAGAHGVACRVLGFVREWRKIGLGAMRKLCINRSGTCYRFNHRDEDLKPLLRKLLQATPTLEIQPILVRFG
ncbi:hypothetical protein ACFSUI_20560 [Ralstonia solanacearum]